MAQNTDEQKTIPFYPTHIKSEIRVVWILIGIVVVIGMIALFNPVGLEDPADPMVTPDHVKPEWYFLALYQLLKYIPKTIGVLIPIVGVLLLLIWPFFTKVHDSKPKMRLRMIGSAVFIIIVIAMTIWGWYS